VHSGFDGTAEELYFSTAFFALQRGYNVQQGSGLVMRNVEINDDPMGTIAAMEFNPPKARILLMLTLLQTGNPAEIQKVFATY